MSGRGQILSVVGVAMICAGWGWHVYGPWTALVLAAVAVVAGVVFWTVVEAVW